LAVARTLCTHREIEWVLSPVRSGAFSSGTRKAFRSYSWTKVTIPIWETRDEKKATKWTEESVYFGGDLIVLNVLLSMEREVFRFDLARSDIDFVATENHWDVECSAALAALDEFWQPRVPLWHVGVGCSVGQVEEQDRTLRAFTALLIPTRRKERTRWVRISIIAFRESVCDSYK